MQSCRRNAAEDTVGRLVRPAPPRKRDARGGVEGAFEDGADVPAEGDGDSYLARVAKYIPAEIVAFFIFANGILKQSITNAAAAASPATMAGFSVASIGVSIFLAAWLCTPVFFWRMREPGDGWRTNAALGFALFPFWAYAVEGVGATAMVPFDGQFASILLGCVTLASGLLRPPQSRAP